ncbi:hypothetical protein BXZ70DRAFT_1012728 [Cristinia sonorae]|uniref:Uncharacterized protein n=1 Tax=Cristinia sonorae TaxID=1940300 RepID=A0A8K0XK48_9AGAR|nr:hypothetical protein BXZ70DRAFT_1012728 [Cristinia sonorae]
MALYHNRVPAPCTHSVHRGPSQNTTRLLQTAKQMAEQVEQEIPGHFELFDDDDLLNNLLPMRDVGVKVVKARIADWQQITQPFRQAVTGGKQPEKAMYKPFLKMANTIVSFFNSGSVTNRVVRRKLNQTKGN